MQTTLQQGSDITTAPAIDWIAYLGPSLMNASSASGANLSTLRQSDPPQWDTVRYFNSTGSRHQSGDGRRYLPSDPYTYISTTKRKCGDEHGHPIGQSRELRGLDDAELPDAECRQRDIDSLYTAGNEIAQQDPVPRHHMAGSHMGRNFVPVFGWRKDTVANSNSNAPKGSSNVSVMDYSVDTSPTIQSSPWARARVGAPFCTPRIRSGRKCRSTRVSASSPMIRRISRLTPAGRYRGNQIRIRAARQRIWFCDYNPSRPVEVQGRTGYKTTDNNATLAGEAGAGFGNNLYYAGRSPIGGRRLPWLL